MFNLSKLWGSLHLRLLPRLILLHAALVQSRCLAVKRLVLSLKVGASIVRSASRRVTLLLLKGRKNLLRSPVVVGVLASFQ